MRRSRESRSRISLRPRFGSETRFSVAPVREDGRSLLERKFEELKRDLVNEQLWDIWEIGSNAMVRRAATDAASIAWTTPFPLLAFPELFEEKLMSYRAQAERQEDIWERSRELLPV